MKKGIECGESRGDAGWMVKREKWDGRGVGCVR